jgi:hypothetical protein
MELTILDHESPSEMTARSFRSKRVGPELDLIEDFLQKSNFQVPRGCNITIFREPRIESGFPDLSSCGVA